MTLASFLHLRSGPMPEELHARPEVSSQPVGASYVWLAYSIFFFIEPIFAHSLLYWEKCLGVYSIFLLLYLAYVRSCNKQRRLLVLGGLYLLGIASLNLNGGATCFFVYVAAMLPFVYPSFQVVVPVVVLEIATIGGTFYVLHPREVRVDAIVASFFIPVVAISNTFVALGRRADAKLKHAQEENLRLAAMAERERIARDLHDVLGHTLSVIVLKAELAGRLIERDPRKASQEVADVEQTARAALAEVREAITGYRSRGLGEEIERARLTLEAAGVDLQTQTSFPVLEPEQETALALALREAVTNIVRHASARSCTVLLRTLGDQVALTIQDDGRGMAEQALHPAQGNGLRGMTERIQGLGGSVQTAHVAGPLSGTALHVKLPVRTGSLVSPTELPRRAEISA